MRDLRWYNEKTRQLAKQLLKHEIMTKNCLLLCLIIWSGCLFAQDVERQQLIDNYVIEYLRILSNQSALYYGKAQEGHQRALNHPYLKDMQYAKASLSYFGITYPEALLRLDWSRDELVIQSPDFQNIVLAPENVDFAELHGEHIVYFRRDSLRGCPSTGYYILLYSGNCRVLEKQTTMLLIDKKAEYYYSITTNFYLYKDNIYHRVWNKRTLLKVLHPYKKELKRFISTHNLRFRRDAPEFIRQTVSEYEKLSGSL